MINKEVSRLTRLANINILRSTLFCLMYMCKCISYYITRNLLNPYKGFSNIPYLSQCPLKYFESSVS